MTISAFAALLALGCTRQKGFHPEDDVPENQARIHQPDYRGGEVEPGELAQTETETEPEREGETEPRLVRVTAVVLDAGLAEACGVDTAKAHFDYDSAELDAEAKATVRQIADCLDEGALVGHSIAIVGHADPRGTDEYNRELGMSRAESVAEVLIREGLDEARVEVESEGEARAQQDPDSWPAARRVDIRIVGS